MGVIMKNKVNYTGADSGDGAVIYSEEEHEVGVWTDGKPLYQKTWTGLNITPSYNSWSNVIPNDVNIETLVRWQALSNVDYKNLDGTGIEWQVYGGYVRAEYNQNANVRTIEILTLQYTKTTDTAGSGIWTTTGEYAHHYSTTEHVIGTWIDGSTLYERTIFTNPTWSNNSTTITLTNEICKNIEGGVCDANGENLIPFGYASPNEYVRHYQASNAISIYNSFTSSRSYVQITIQYTKNT